MKAQVLEPEEVVEFVPQILNLKKILVPIDFSDMSKHAFQYALRFAEQFRCKIVLLHVVEPETVIAGTSLGVDVFAQLEDDMTAAKAELAALAASSRDRPNSVASMVRSGHAPNEITKAAKDLDVDLIMIATTAIAVGGICASAARLSAWCERRRVQSLSSAKRSTTLSKENQNEEN